MQPTTSAEAQYAIAMGDEPEKSDLTALVLALPISAVLWLLGYLLVAVALKGCP